jgi:hypothetical protein
LASQYAGSATAAIACRFDGFDAVSAAGPALAMPVSPRYAVQLANECSAYSTTLSTAGISSIWAAAPTKRTDVIANEIFIFHLGQR